MTAAERIRQPATWCSNSMNLPVRCRIRTRAAGVATQWQADLPPAQTLWGGRCCAGRFDRVRGILRLLEAALQAAAQDELADRAFTVCCWMIRAGWNGWPKCWKTPIGRALLPRWTKKAVETPRQNQRRSERNPAASAAAELRDRAKKQTEQPAAKTGCCVPRLSLRQTAAVPHRWWRHLCRRYSCLLMLTFKRSLRKKCWITLTMSICP